MKKNLLLLIALCFGVLLAQAQIADPTVSTPQRRLVGYMDNLGDELYSPNRSQATCSLDSVKYTFFKASGLQIYTYSGWGGAAQYYGNASGLTVHGVNIYMRLDTPTAGVSIPLTVKLTGATAQGRPTATTYATTTYNLNNAGIGSTSVSAIKKYVPFPSPVTITSNYCVVVEWGQANGGLVLMVVNNDGDGNGEDYSSLNENGVWKSNLNDYGFDEDHLHSPVIGVTFTDPSFTLDPPCFPSGQSSVTLDLTYPAIMDNKFYSYNAFYQVPERCHYWQYGDGNGAHNFDHSYTYAAQGQYTITLKDTLRGWTRLCIPPQVTAVIAGSPSAAFTSNVTNNTVSFTAPTATPAGTYAWDFGDGGTSTSQNPTHTFASTGTFTVCLTVTNICGPVNHCENITIATVGVDPSTGAGIHIGPVPAENELRLSTETLLNDARFELYDLVGARVLEVQLGEVGKGQSLPIDVQGIQEGIYFAKVKADGIETVQKIWLR